MEVKNIMTYTAPELHLVGAAQNLVLGRSETPHKDIDCPVREPGLPEIFPYLDVANW